MEKMVHSHIVCSGIHECSSYYYALDQSKIGEKIYNLLFKDANNNDEDFWLSTKYIDTGSNYCCFGLLNIDTCAVNYYYLFGSSNDSKEHGHMVRPVVTLKSDVKLNDSTNGWTLSYINE